MKRGLCVFVILMMMVFPGMAFSEASNDLDFAFQDDVAWYKHDGKFGLKHRNGTILCEATFDTVQCFQNNGLALVYEGSKRGMINKAGTIIIQPDNYSFLGTISYSYGNYVIEAQDIIIFQIITDQGKKYGCYALDGQMISPALWDEIMFFEGNNGFVRKDQQWNILDRQGNLLLEHWLDGINGKFQYGWFDEENKSTYISIQGEIIKRITTQQGARLIELTIAENHLQLDAWEDAEYLFSNIMKVKDEEGWKIASLHGDLLYNHAWKRIERVAGQDRIAILYDENGEAILSEQGKILPSNHYYNEIQLTRANTMIAMDNDSMDILNMDGQELCRIEGVIWAVEADNVIQYATDCDIGFLSLYGVPIGTLSKKEWYVPDSTRFKNGFCIFYEAEDQRYGGFIDMQGNVYTHEAWEYIKDFGGDRSFVCVNDRYWLIDHTGTIVADTSWETVKSPFKQTGDMWIACVTAEDGWGYINTDGAPLVWYDN